MDIKPTFAERVAALKAAAETVMLEAQRMEAAERRFSERKNFFRKARQGEAAR